MITGPVFVNQTLCKESTFHIGHYVIYTISYNVFSLSNYNIIWCVWDFQEGMPISQTV